MGTIITAIHGIGFSRTGELEPFLEKLSVAKDSRSVDANWNDVAAKDYSDEITFKKIFQLCRALTAISEMRPRPTSRRRLEIAIEWLIDLLDVYFTAIFWALPPIIAVTVLAVIQELFLRPRPQFLLDVIKIYLVGYAALFTLAALLLTTLTLSRAPAIAISRAMHVFVAALRPGLVLSFCYLAMTRWKGESGWIGSSGIVFILGSAAAGVMAYFGSSMATGWQLGLLAAGLYFVGPLVTAVAIMPALKLTFDVLLYITDPDYREAVIGSIVAKIEQARELDKRTALVLIGHSLGSVIAADLIVSRQLQGKFRSVTLVTAGSPIRRMFQRLLPGHLLPATPADIITSGSAQFDFRWINYFRRLDAVGARLHLPSGTTCTEKASSLIRDPLSSHVNYWTEQPFIDFVRSEIQLHRGHG